MQARARDEPAEDPAVLALRLPAVAASARTLRRAATDHARRHRADPDAVAFAVGEAAANAVVHAYRDRAPGEITLDARADGGELRVEIADGGRGFDPAIESDGLGLGLGIIARLTTRREIVVGRRGGTTVRMWFGTGAPARDAGAPAADRLVCVGAMARLDGEPGAEVARVRAADPAAEDLVAFDRGDRVIVVLDVYVEAVQGGILRRYEGPQVRGLWFVADEPADNVSQAEHVLRLSERTLSEIATAHGLPVTTAQLDGLPRRIEFDAELGERLAPAGG